MELQERIYRLLLREFMHAECDTCRHDDTSKWETPQHCPCTYSRSEVHVHTVTRLVLGEVLLYLEERCR